MSWACSYDDPYREDEGLSGGAVAGIVIGSIAAVASLGILGILGAVFCGGDKFKTLVDELPKTSLEMVVPGPGTVPGISLAALSYYPVEAALKELRLGQFAAQIRELGATTAADLRDLEEADLEGLGLKVLEKRRLLRFAKRE